MAQISEYWKRSGVTEKSEGKVWSNDQKTRYGCDECCNGDRCDDPSHYHRPNCPFCLGTGQNLTSEKLNSEQNAQGCDTTGLNQGDADDQIKIDDNIKNNQT